MNATKTLNKSLYNGIILSTNLKSLTLQENIKRDNALRTVLSALNVPFESVKGVYKGTEELSILLPIDYHGLALRLARVFNQESILTFNIPEQTAQLCFVSQPIEHTLRVTYFDTVAQAIVDGSIDGDHSRIYTTNGTYVLKCK